MAKSTTEDKKSKQPSRKLVKKDALWRKPANGRCNRRYKSDGVTWTDIESKVQYRQIKGKYLWHFNHKEGMKPFTLTPAQWSILTQLQKENKIKFFNKYLENWSFKSKNAKDLEGKVRAKNIKKRLLKKM